MEFVVHVFVSVWCRKARKLFEKNAAPVLHVAGMDVTVVEVRCHYFCDKKFTYGK